MGGSELVFLLDKLTNVSLSITLICSFSQSWPCKCAKILVETHQVRNFTALLEGSDSVMLGSQNIYLHLCFIGLCLDKGGKMKNDFEVTMKDRKDRVLQVSWIRILGELLMVFPALDLQHVWKHYCFVKHRLPLLQGNTKIHPTSFLQYAQSSQITFNQRDVDSA